MGGTQYVLALALALALALDLVSMFLGVLFRNKKLRTTTQGQVQGQGQGQDILPPLTFSDIFWNFCSSHVCLTEGSLDLRVGGGCPSVRLLSSGYVFVYVDWLLTYALVIVSK